MSVDELSDMEKEVNDFCNDDDDDDSNDRPSRPNKQQRVSSFAPVTTSDDPDNTNADEDDQNNDYHSDSSSSQKLRDLILGKRGENDSDEESLGDGDIPRGWSNNPKTKTDE